MHLNLFSRRHRRLVLGLDSQYLRNTGEGQIATYFGILAFCATGEGSLVSRAHRITLCSQAVYYVNGISIRIYNFRIE